MNIILLDDEPGVLESLKRHFTEQYGERHSCTYFSDCEECFRCISSQSSDLLILDIRINGTSCINLFSHRMSGEKTPEIIFITGYPLDYCEEIFEGIRPFAFLKKPLDYQKLFRAVDELEKTQKGTEKKLSIKIKGVDVLLPARSVYFAESRGRLVHLYCREEQYEYYGKLSALSEELPELIRCHASFTVNPEYIAQLEKNSFILYDGTKIPISRKYGGSAKNEFFRYKGGLR